jgi:hypothetical protein
MKILQAPQEQWQELSQNLIVTCGYQTKQGEQVFGIDMMFKSQYPDFLEVEVLDPNDIWHDDTKVIQLVQTQEGFNWTSMNLPELAMYRKTNNIVTYQYNGDFYFYVNFLLPEHRTLFETNINLEITINEL